LKTYISFSTGTDTEYSFDAWGRRRDKDNWSYTLSSEPDLFAGRGFTAHEHLPWFNLINMNGRLYDPLVGRFLSPDENVQMPDFTQNFNRYSYALNNPMKYTDPDGEWFLIDDAISFVVGGIINVIFNAGEIDNFWEGLGYFASGGAGAWIAVQSFGLAAPVGAAITTFGNSTLETNFLTKENDYSFSSITSAQWEKIGKKTLIGGVSGYVGGKLGEKISNKLINSFNIKTEFWSKTTERMISGGIANGLNDYGNSTLINGNKWYSKEAIFSLGIGTGKGIAMGFSYTYVEQKWAMPTLKKLQLSLRLEQNNNINTYDFIYNNKFTPYVNPIPGVNPINPGNLYNPTIKFPIIK